LTILETLKSNQLLIGGATFGGTLIGLALEKYSQGSANVGHRYAKSGMLGATVGFGLGSAIALTKEAAAMSGKPAWGIIGGATGTAGGLLYQLVKKNYTMKTLITTAAIGGTIGGGIGTAISVYQKTR